MRQEPATPLVVTPKQPKEPAKKAASFEHLDWYKKHATKIFEVTCEKHKGVVAYEVEVPGYEPERGHVNGLIVVPTDEHLLGYRTRSDKTMGYQCACGADERVLAEEEPLMRVGKMLPHVAEEIKDRLKKRGVVVRPNGVFTRKRLK